MDGLDELASERQEGCVNKINEFLQEWMGDLVVCSRIEEYKHYEALLGLHNSIVLQPLRWEQIQDYVQNEALLQLIEGDVDLMELAQIPLMLNIMVVASLRLDFQWWQQVASTQERLDYLFETYINTVLGKPCCTNLSPKQTRRWLGWLAVQLIRENETEFLIEKMQSYWLESKIQRLIWGLMGGVTLGWIFGLTIGLFVGPTVGLIYSFIYGSIFGLIYGLIGEKIKTAERLKWDWKKAKESLPLLVVFVLIAGLIAGPITGLIVGRVIGPILGLSVGLIVGLTYGLTRGFTGAEIENKTVPNQGIRQSLINVLFFWAIAYLPSIGVLYVSKTVSGLDFEWYKLLIGGLGIALLNAIAHSRAFIEHFALRLVLWGNGYAPWNYARFLDYATKHLLMQQVGGGYRFLHDLLRQHFAKHYR